MILSVFAFFTPFILFFNFLSFGKTEAELGIGSIAYMALVAVMAFMILGGRFKRMILLFAVLFMGFLALSGNLEDIAQIIVFFLTLFAAYQAIDSGKKMDLVLDAMLSAIVCAAVFGILHYFLFPGVMTFDRSLATNEFGYLMFRDPKNPDKFRETSVFFGANVFGLLSVIGQVINLFTRRKLWHKAAYAMILLIGIVLSNSRSALVMFFLAHLLHLLLNPRFSKSIKIGFSAVLLTGFLFIAPALNSRFSFGGLQDEQRLLKNLLGLQILAANPLYALIGFPGEFEYTANGITVSDNMYILFAIQIGILGMLLLFLFFLYVTFHPKLRRIGDPNARTIQVVVFFFFLSGFFSNSIAILPLTQYIAILVGYMVRARGRQV